MSKGRVGGSASPADASRRVQMTNVERGHGVLYGLCAGVWVMTLFGAPSADDMRRSLGSLQVARRQLPGGFPTLTWILPTAGYRMDEEARTVAIDMTRRFEASIVAQATLVEGTGFQAAAVRGIVSGLDLIMRATIDRRVFAELEVAVAWCLARRPGPAEPIRAAEVAQALLATKAGVG